MRDNEKKLALQIEELKIENVGLQDSLKMQIEKTLSSRDQLHGDVIQARQRVEEESSEKEHLKLSYERVCQEKTLAEQQLIQAKNEVSSYRSKVLSSQKDLTIRLKNN